MNKETGYKIYNLIPAGESACKGTLVVQLGSTPEGEEFLESGCWLAMQEVRAEKQGSRWVVLPQGDFQAVKSERVSLKEAAGVDDALPIQVYEGQAEDFILRLFRQTSYSVDSYAANSGWLFTSNSFDTTPQPDGSFSVFNEREIFAVYTGDPKDKGNYHHIAESYAAIRDGGARTELDIASHYPQFAEENASGNSSDGSAWGGKTLEQDWESPVFLSGGGGDGGRDLSDRYAANLYLNGKLAAELNLLPAEGALYDG